MNEITPTKVSKIGELPYCIQGSEAPAFEGKLPVDERLMCASECGQILIENFAKDSYVNVGIKCFRCGKITRTPSLDLGEVFAAHTVTMGDKGPALLGSTVYVRPGVILTCDQEIAQEIEATAPKQQGLELDITASGLEELGRLYTDITGCDLDQQRRIINRKGAPAVRVFPFAWAIGHLEDGLSKDLSYLSQNDTLTALLWLHIFCYVVGIWRHHPRFQSVARDLGKPTSFLHTSSLLLAAAHLYDAGNRIGFALEDKQGVPNPDLYIRGVAGRRFFLEVKAPAALQWSIDSQEAVAKTKTIVRQCVKRSRRQINRNHPGILIISSSHVSQTFPEIFKKCIKSVLKSKGRDHKSMAAIVSVSPSHFEISKPNAGGLKIGCGFRFNVNLNDHYEGENPIRISPKV